MFGRRQHIKAARRADAEGLISLAKLRLWQTQETGAGASSAGTQNTEVMIPKSRFDEVNQRAKTAEDALKKFQDEQAAAESDRLAKQGEWQAAAENERKRVAELEPYKARAEASEAVIGDANKALIAQLPEDIRGTIVPQGLAPHALYAWLNANVPMLLNRPAPNIDAGASGGASGVAAALSAEEIAVAAKSGMSEADWRKAKQKAGQS